LPNAAQVNTVVGRTEVLSGGAVELSM